MSILFWIILVCCVRGRMVGQSAVGLGEGEVFLGQSGWSIAVRGEGVAHESWINKRFIWVIFHPVEAQEAQEIHIWPKVRGLQNSNLNSVGWNNICHRARLHFCKLVRHMRYIGFTVYPFIQFESHVPFPTDRRCQQTVTFNAQFFCVNVKTLSTIRRHVIHLDETKSELLNGKLRLQQSLKPYF